MEQNINALPDQYLALRDEANRVSANPFAGLISIGTLSATSISRGQLLRPYPQFTGVTLGYRPLGTTGYNSLQATVTRQLGNSLFFIGSYTWGKLLQRRSYLNPNADLERVISQMDRTQRLVVSGQWQIPFGVGTRHGRSVPKPLLFAIGNWELGWISTFQPGQPLGAWSGAVAGGAPANIEPTVDKWFDTSAFRPQPPFTLASLSSYASRLRADGTANVDLTLGKNFPIGERVAFRLTVQLNNATNSPQFNAPNLAVTSPAFGTVTTQANQARWMFLGGKLSF